MNYKQNEKINQGQERQNVNDRYRLFVGSSYFIIHFLFS